MFTDSHQSYKWISSTYQQEVCTWLTSDVDAAHVVLWAIRTVIIGTLEDRTQQNFPAVAEDGPASLSTLIRAPQITCWDVINVQAGDVEPCPETAV